jgi:hypothetical protein
LAQSNLNTESSLAANLQLTKFAASSLNANASLNASALVSKLAASSLTGAGTLAANLTVTSAGFDADAQAFFNRVTTAGGTLTTTEQNAVNTLVVGMKEDGIWTKMKAIYPMVGGGAANPAAACAQNLKSASFTGTFSSGWTFASTGAKPNGTSAFMDTNLPNNTMSQNSLTICTYLRTDFAIPAGCCDIGCWNGAFGSSIYSGQSVARIFLNNNSSTQINLLASSSNSTGFYLNKRTLSSEVVFQKNSTQTTVSNNSSNLLTANFIVSRAGNFNGEYSPRETALVGIGDGLTNAEASNFYTRVQAFQTTLNRQINP